MAFVRPERTVYALTDTESEEISRRAQFRALLRVARYRPVFTAVADRLMADVPLGVFLSGGLDSTSVVALMNEVSSDPIDTFSIGFANSAYDETLSHKKSPLHSIRITTN
jgi:asparagine synthetase B (glutamine-hydrolysing)